MRHFAMTGISTTAMISRIFFGEAMRATPPSARICAGTRSSAITAPAPARSAISACFASVTSMMTPPLSISARPVLRRRLVLCPLFCDMGLLFSGNSYQRSAFSRQPSAQRLRGAGGYVALTFILQPVHNSRYPLAKEPTAAYFYRASVEDVCLLPRQPALPSLRRISIHSPTYEIRRKWLDSRVARAYGRQPVYAWQS